MTSRSLNLSKFIFHILLVCLPINLGLHFVNPSSYVGGLLIDYLIPTIFIQDILVLLLLATWIFESKKDLLRVFESKRFVSLILLFYVVLLSVLTSVRFLPSGYILVRWFLYSLFVIYVYFNFDHEVDTRFFAKTISFWSIFLGVLALLQYIKQGSVFNNYLFFGEQPYTAATALIDRENIFGSRLVPAYGIFRHPNIFGGFISISIVVLLDALKNKYISLRSFVVSTLIGTLALVLTFSYFSWVAAALGSTLYLFQDRKHLRNILITALLSISFLGFFINKIQFPALLLDNPSVSNRIDLLQAGYRSAEAYKYLFGSGINTSTVIIERYTTPNNFLRFVQPAHNVFVMLLGEIGLIGVLLFAFILAKSLGNALKGNFLVFVVLLQIILLSSFDHYFVTIPQMFLLLFLFIGIVL